MDGLVQIQVVVQANAGAVGVMGLDTQGGVWYGELSEHHHRRANSIKWTRSKRRRSEATEPGWNGLPAHRGVSVWGSV